MHQGSPNLGSSCEDWEGGGGGGRVDVCVCEGMNGIDGEEGGGKEEVRKRERVERESGGREGGREGGKGGEGGEGGEGGGREREEREFVLRGLTWK